MKKNYDNMLSRFHPIGLPERYGQTDGRMDGQTDRLRQNSYINIARQCADAR